MDLKTNFIKTPMHLLRYFLLAMKGEFQMAVNETIVTGRKFRKLVDEATKLWQRISFWGVASDVEFDDGENAETKFGAISGITDSLTSTSSNVAASAAAVKALNDKITELNSDLTKRKLVMTNTYGNGVMPTTGCSVTITVPDDCTKGILIADLYGYNDGTGSSIQITNGAGIKSSVQLLDCSSGDTFKQSAYTSIWDCSFNPGRTITLLFKNPKYGSSNNKIMIAY